MPLTAPSDARHTPPLQPHCSRPNVIAGLRGPEMPLTALPFQDAAPHFVIPPHPRFNRIFNTRPNVIGTRSNRPADVIPHVWRCHCSPEHRDSTKCFLITSCRGATYPCFSLPTTRLTTSRQNSKPCTPRYCTKGPGKQRVYSPPHPCAEPRGNGL